MKIVLRALLLTFLSMTIAVPAWAGFQEGADAYYRGDYQTAMSEWMPLANSGNAEAQNAIGALYDHGLGVMTDEAEAFRWYSLAANQGYPMAMRNLGTMYATAHGVPYSLEQAQLWLSKAAAAGDDVAVQRLAALPPVATPPANPVRTPLSADLSAPAPATQPAADDKFGGNSGSASLLSALDSKAAAATATAAAAATATPAAADSSADTAAAPAAATTAAGTATPAAQQQPRGLTFPPAVPAGDAATNVEAEPAPAAAPVAAVQQAAITPAPQPSGNWLLGQWEGPSLGCPPGGGFEFTSTQTRSYYQGNISVALPATYELKGDRIVVHNPGTQGSYTYRQSGPDTVTIEAAPPVMPASIIGVKYKRCGPAPSAAATQSALVPADVPPVAPTTAGTTAAADTAAAVPQPSSSDAVPATPTEDAPTGAEAQKAATTSSGWDAFERGDYAGALAIWKPQALKGDRNLQVLVGSMYDYGQGVQEDKKEALKWYLMAAQRGSGRGQFAAANLLSHGDAGPRNLVEAYKWLTLANQSLANQAGQVTPVQALELRDQISRQMSQTDIDKAQSLASNFKGQG